VLAGLVSALVAVVAAGCGRSALDLEEIGEGGLPTEGGGPEAGTDSSKPPHCGDGTCDDGETCTTCSADCGLCPGCGDGMCDDGETCSSCPQDCGLCATCPGDGKCDGAKTCENCAQVCGFCATCGDGVCSAPTETCYTCPKDCGKCPGCGDGTCGPNETCASCPQDCGVCAYCGDGVCEKPYETCVNCPQDCGMCPIISCAMELTCALGCFNGATNPPMISISCIGDCISTGCPAAQSLADQAVNCFIDNIGTCGGLSISCLMSACMGPVDACLSETCPPGQ
jgi:hypothetical protein